MLRLLAQSPHLSAPAASNRPHWSSLLPMWLRKHGFVFNNGPRVRDDEFVVAAQGALPPVDLPAGFYEGPFDRASLEKLDLGAREMRGDRVALYPCGPARSERDPECFDGLAYGRDVLRRIPTQRGEKSDPYVWQPEDMRLAPGPVPVQVFEQAPGWHVLAHARLDDTDEMHPVLVSNGRIVVSGVPLFDLVGRKHWIPAIEHGYYSLEHDPFPVEAELWLARLIRASALAAGVSVTMLDPWPNGRRAALTIRFDHDRDISSESFSSLLGFLERHKLRASWGFLVRLAPSEKMAQARAEGHEIVLHTEASDRSRFVREVQTLRDAGSPVAGVTAHGGIGSAGHLGQAYFDWAAAAGLRHADTLSRNMHAPHPMVKIEDGSISTGPIYLPPLHHSLDHGTAPTAHYLDDLLRDVPSRLAAGDHVTVMNHPDIHRPEFERLLSGLALDDVWPTTHRQATDWIDATRFGWRWDASGSLAFKAPLPHDLTIRTFAATAERSGEVLVRANSLDRGGKVVG